MTKSEPEKWLAEKKEKTMQETPETISEEAIREIYWKVELKESLTSAIQSLKDAIEINRYPAEKGTCSFFLTCFTQAKRGGIDVTEAEALIKNNLWVHEECLVECDWFKPFERLKLKGLTDSQKLMLLLQVDEYLCVLDYLTKTIDLRENWVQGLIKSLPSPILLSQESREKVQHMIAEGPIIGPYLEYLNSACNLGEACG
jgi:hypothetical protein